MNRALLLGAFLACVTVAGSGAFAAGGTKIINKSGFDVDHLYTAAPGKDVWSDDLMAGLKDPIDAGKTEVVDKLQPGTYDFKMTDDDDGGAPCIVKNVKVKAGAPLTLTKKMVAGCK